MSGRGGVAHRSAGEWIARGLLAVAACAFGYRAVEASRGQVLAAADPATAYALDPGNGQIAGLQARHLAGSDPTAADRLARRSLASEPLSPAAVTTIGLNAQIRGDLATARRSLAFAKRLSQRDLQTQLWAIEDAVGRGDVRTAVRGYDIALRTSKFAPDLLYPVLAGALSEPAVRSALTDVLTASPPWASAFIGHAASYGKAPGAAAALFSELHRRGVAVDESADAAVVSGLANQGQAGQAWAHYISFRRGADRRRSRDALFRHDPARAAIFDWRLLDDAGVTVSIQPGPRHGMVDFAVPASVGGRVIEQVQMLPPGRYRLEGRSALIDQPRGSSPYWSLACRGGRELDRVDLPNSSVNDGRFAGDMTVPVDCVLQTLTLVARPSDAVGGSTGQIGRVQLQPSG